MQVIGKSNFKISYLFYLLVQWLEYLKTNSGSDPTPVEVNRKSPSDSMGPGVGLESASGIKKIHKWSSHKKIVVAKYIGTILGLKHWLDSEPETLRRTTL